MAGLTCPNTLATSRRSQNSDLAIFFSSRYRNDRGYSFIEIMIVIGILAIMVSIVSPRLANHKDSMTLNRVTQELITGMDMARNVANARGITTSIVLLEDGRITGFQIGYGLSVSQNNDTASVLLDESFERLEVDVTPNWRRMTFFPHSGIELMDIEGVILPTQNSVLQMVDSNKTTVNVVIFATTGRAYVE